MRMRFEALIGMATRTALCLTIQKNGGMKNDGCTPES
ncbi:hypothetical protein FHS16_005384 [Paenibacillus endophyticus]|uniref:Uncharacterized protein n=1 Tax=Paenibacillus endophyticus TaxID=1294268 RepID=A0A7W5GCV4_9BACL|nr:hypothetical protein [Paenibacillus endophyticus]